MSRNMCEGNNLLPPISSVRPFSPFEGFSHTGPAEKRLPSWHSAEDLVSKYLPGYRAVTMQHAFNIT